MAGRLAGRRAIVTGAASGIGAASARLFDIGRMDEQGFVQILDRKKDMIISGGMNIYPTDLEAVLGKHPAVADVSVIGASDDRWGETPLAFIVRERGSETGGEEFLAWANERLARNQRIGCFMLVDDLPRNQLGKVLKRELRLMEDGQV